MKKIFGFSAVFASALNVASAADSVMPPISFDSSPGQTTAQAGPGWMRLPNGNIMAWGTYSSNNDGWIVVPLPVAIGTCLSATISMSGWPVECYNNVIRVNRDDSLDGTYVGYYTAIGNGTGAGTNYGGWAVPPRDYCGTGTPYQCQ